MVGQLTPAERIGLNKLPVSLRPGPVWLWAFVWWRGEQRARLIVRVLPLTHQTVGLSFQWKETPPSVRRMDPGQYAFLAELFV